MSLKEHGIEKFGRLIDQNIAQARYLGGLIEAEPRLQLLMPPSINIVCYRFRPDGMEGDALKALNVEIGRAHSELQSLMRISYAVFCLKQKNRTQHIPQ